MLIALSEFLVAAAAALVYDIVICMDQEVSIMQSIKLREGV